MKQKIGNLLITKHGMEWFVRYELELMGQGRTLREALREAAKNHIVHNRLLEIEENHRHQTDRSMFMYDPMQEWLDNTAPYERDWQYDRDPFPVYRDVIASRGGTEIISESEEGETIYLYQSNGIEAWGNTIREAFDRYLCKREEYNEHAQPVAVVADDNDEDVPF